MRLKRSYRERALFILLLVLPLLAFGQAEIEQNPDQQTEPDKSSEAAGDEEVGNEEGPTLDERLDALLSEVSAYEGREPQRCLSTRAYRTVKVLNTEYLLFSRGSTHWLNKLKRDCQSLQFNKLPVFESRGTSSLCQNDPFYPSNSMDLQHGLSGGRPVAMHGVCYLGNFEAISPEQAALLTEQK